MPRPRIPRIPTHHQSMANIIRQHTLTAMSYTTTAHPRKRPPAMTVHPDGSRRPEGAGAGVYVEFPGAVHRSLTAKLHLGDRSLYTSVEAEYWAAMLSLDFVESVLAMGYSGREFYIAADYRGVLHSLQMETSPPSHAHMASMVHNRAKQIMQGFPGVRILPVHTPAHSGIMGNEKADKAARDAARGETGVDFCEDE